jgi:autotransporter-associated beta strand protein
VAAVGSGTTTTFYRNGVLVGTANGKSVTNIFTVGASPAGGGMQRFAQLIDDVYIYQSALTPTQIMTLYNSGAGTAANSIPDSSTVTIASGAFLDLNGSWETIGTLAGAGTVTSGIAGSPTLTVGSGNGSGSFSGVIQNGAGTVSLAKTGTGTQTLSGSNLYTGATAGNNGTLVINGSVTNNVTVTTPGVLNGSGTVTGNVSGNGTFSPGNGPGIMTIVGNFTPSGTVNFEVNSSWTAAGTHFDQYLVTGLVNMAGSTVTFSNTADASAPAANSVIKLIDNNGTLDLTTAATTPLDGASITIGSRSFRLFYNGGDGNDVTVVWPNTAPTAANSSVTSNEDSTYIFSATDFNFSDTDSGDVLSSVTITTIESAGDLEWFDGSIWVDVSQDQEISKADIDANRLRFVPAANANGSSYATFSFKVKDTGGPVLSVEAYTLTINLSAINDVPVILNNTLSISEGATVVLGSSNINATDPDNTPSQLIYTASSITAGQFEFAVNPGVAITSFTQDDINNSRVRFVHDGGEAAPSYSLVVSDGDLSSAASTVTIGTFTNVNDAPVISTNKLSVRERTTVVLGTSNISATDTDNSPNQLTYTASSITGGRFEFAVNPGVAITSFTQDDINNSRVRFVDFGDVAFPSYSLTVSDGADISGPSIVELTGQSMTFVVTSTADSGAGSLRQAIIDSNVGLGYDTITFNIPGAGVRPISPTTALPTITDAVVINGYTQPGSSANTLTTRNNAVILVELNGASAGAGANGLTINSAGSLVTGLAINRFHGMGIHVHGAAAQNNTLQGNFVGLNASGTTAQANGSWGIFVDGSPNTTIGGATNGKRNLVSGNSQGGVAIVGSTAIGLAIEGNWIGTDITGSLDRGNALSGVYVGDAAGFGGVTSTGSPSQSVIRNNVISGNDNAGLWINSGADNTQVYGNLIGTNASGSEAIGNTDYGIHVQSNFNQIGGSTPAHRNVVSGNLHGVSIGSGGTNNQVIGNYIGTDVSGLMPIQNSAFGIRISTAGNSVDGNTIANNRLGGLRLEGTTGNNGTYINNTFSGNLGLAIDVGTVGRTLNDLPDVDGALNYPVVTSTQIVGNELIVEGTMEADKTVEIYISAPTADGFGQGRQRLVSAIDNSLADENTASGQFLFRIPLGNGLSHGTPLTALTVGSTSEFSPISFAGEVGSSLAPQIKLSAASVSVTSGNAIGVDGSFYDPDSVSWDGTVDYGDGSDVQPLTLNSDNTFRLDHTYVTAGSFTVTVQIRDNTLISSTKTAAVIVQNAAPTASFNEFSLTTPANEGQTVTLTGQFEDTTGTHTATIDWGDGTTSEVTPTPTLHGQIVSLGDGKYAIQATHVYVDDSNSSNAASPSDVYRVVVTVRDETGASDSTPASLLRQEIRNVRPSALNVGFSSTSITEGQSITLSSLSFVDPGVQDVHTLKVNWGDGFESLIALPIGTRSLADLTPTQLANLTNLTHIYADDPSAGSDEYTITVEVADDDEPDSLNSVKASQPISVLNAQPSNVTFSLSSGPFAESSAVTIAAGSFVDAGNDKHRVFIDWGDGTAVVTADLEAGVLDFSQIPLEKRTHVYRNDPSGTSSSYTISVRVADNDDRETFGSSSSVVSIANVGPVLSDVTLDQSGPIEEGDTVTVTGRFTDVGQLDRHRVNVNWGDGTSSSANLSVIPPISPTADIIYAFTATHIFGGNFNPANIVVSVEDGRYVEGVFEPDGGVDSASLSLVVRNVAPKAFIAPTLDSTRGATTFVAQVTDPGVMDTFTYAWSINGVPVTNDGDPAPDRLLLDATSFSSPPLIQVTITDEDGGTGSFDVQAIFGLDAPETLTINDPVTDSNGNTTISYTDVDNTIGTAPVTVVGSFVALSRNILVMGFGGDDTLDASRLTADFATILNGGSQTDYLIGGAGADFFFAHSGNDTVEGRAGADTYLLKPNSILTVIDAIGDNKLDFSPANFADSTGITFDLSSINLGSLTSQTVSTSGSTEHIVRAMGSFSRLVGSQFGDTLTAASNSNVSGGAGNDQLKIADGVSGASLRGGADDDILNIDAGASVSNINFGGDEGIDSLTNLGSITGLAFNGGADDDQLLNVGTILGTLNFGGDDGVDALFNTGSIANLTFNGGADDDIFVNNGSAETTLSFNGDDDVLLSGTGSIGTLNFGGDDGVDIFANLGNITTLTFNGGADDDIFVNNGLDVMTLNFGGDDDVLLSGAGTIGTLNFGGDDGVDALLNTGNIGTLVFDGGADDDIFVNNGSVATNLSFNGDDDVLLAGAGTIGTLTFNGGADDDIFANLGNITSLAFNGGADDDIFVNNGNAVSTLSFGGDDDVLLAERARLER